MVLESCFGSLRLQCTVVVRRDELEGDARRTTRIQQRGNFLVTTDTVQPGIPTAFAGEGVMPTDRRERMLELADEYGTAIFEDDCYAELTFDGTRPRSIRALDQLEDGGQVIYCGSFSKTIAPALRVGYLIAPTCPESAATNSGTVAVSVLPSPVCISQTQP